MQMECRPYTELKTLSTGKLVSLLLICLLTPALSNAANDVSRDAMEYFFNQSFNALNEELETSIEENKSGIFIMFSDKDCPWCAKMKSTIMSQKSVQDYYRENFRVLMIDINGDTLMGNFDGSEILEKDFSFKQYRVRATPVMMFFDNTGKTMMRHTGIVRNTEEFLWLGEYVVSGAYKKSNFTRYKRARKTAQSSKPGE